MTIRALPTGYHDLRVYNNLTGIGVNIPLKKDINESMKEMKPDLKYLTRPELTWMVVNWFRQLSIVPSFMAKDLVVGFGTGCDYMLSNIPFSDHYYHINGKKIHKLRFFNNVMFFYNLGSLVITYADQVSFTSCAHKHLNFDASDFPNMVMKILEEECEKVRK